MPNLVYESDTPGATIKLIDFGFAARMKPDTEADSMNEQLGTPQYMAPELWFTGSLKGGTIGEYDSSVDMCARSRFGQRRGSSQ